MSITILLGRNCVRLLGADCDFVGDHSLLIILLTLKLGGGASEDPPMQEALQQAQVQAG